MKELTPHQRETLEFQKHISLTANAGSGKTFVLSRRFIEVYLKNDVLIDQIFAITFTDKAAGELKRRIFNEVEERLDSENDELLRKKLEKLRRELVFANISTIHSFCIKILREYALEAGIDANFIPIDQQTSEELIELVVEESLQNMIRDPDFELQLRYLIRFFGSKNIFKTILEKAIHQRKIIERLHTVLYNQSEIQIAEYFRTQFHIQFERAFKDKFIVFQESIKKINKHVLALGKVSTTANDVNNILTEGNWNSVEKIIYDLGGLKNMVLTKDNSVRSRGYLSKERENYISEILIIESFFKEMGTFLNIDFTGKSEMELARFGKNFLTAFFVANNQYQNKKSQRSYLDFDDILIFTQRIIQSDSVRNYLSNNFKFIMIDEYQDTNEIQYEIFMPLLNNLNSGNLFVVGDEKQSIYMFREAELEVFNKTKKDIQQQEELGRILNLPHSFRMVPQLVLFTNKIFSKLFENPVIEFNEVEQSNLICAKEENEEGSVSILLADSNSDSSEADLTAKKILQVLNVEKSINYKDIAILCRKRDSFHELEQTLVKYQIPFSIYGGKGFYQRQTIYDLYNYLTFLINPKDDAALVGVLRSPFFDLSDTKIYLISLCPEETFYQKLILYSRTDETIQKICSHLDHNIKLAFHIEIYSLIRKLLLESGYWSLLSARQNSLQEIANIEKLLSLAREYSRKGFKTLYDFTISLKEAINGYENEGQAQIAQDENTVKMMTIHQAKGLEFKVVIIYAANQKGQEDSIKTKSVSVEKNLGILTKVPIDENYYKEYSIPPIAAYFNYSIQRKSKAELKRLLYVAITRAVKHLIISVSHKEFKAIEGSFFQLLAEGIGSDFSNGSIHISSDVEFMRYIDGAYKFYKHPIELKISIENEIPDCNIEAEKIKPVIVKKQLLIQKIGDIPKHEIISATKISMFVQCPVKYQLTYELGYSPILALIKTSSNQFEFHSGEDDEMKRYAQLRGKLIHEILSTEIKVDSIREFIHKKLLGEETICETENFIHSIIKDVSNFYLSINYQKVNAYKKYKNEYEIYCKEGEYFLYGIIDKLIYDDNSLLIVDYKTDNIMPDQIRERAKNYFPQLQFYAYVLNHLHPDIENYILQLVFIKHPEEIVSQKLDRAQLKEVGVTINAAIKKIYSYNYNPNLEHCSQCQFAMEGNKCIRPY
jgi:ATP-dependent helicase/nuclease subunit A